MELSEVGYFSKTHGVKGLLILRMDKDFETKGLTVLFVESPTGNAPYFISDINDQGHQLIVQLEDVETIEKARGLVNKKVFVESKFVTRDEPDNDWLGFEVIDKSLGSLGKIISISDNGPQLLVSLNFRGKEIILPMVDDFIERVEEGSKKIYFNAPEGLIEVYLDTDNTPDQDA